MSEGNDMVCCDMLAELNRELAGEDPARLRVLHLGSTAMRTERMLGQVSEKVLQRGRLMHGALAPASMDAYVVNHFFDFVSVRSSGLDWVTRGANPGNRSLVQ